MSDLRTIIVNATSEMLDEPGEHGIYKTGRFYDRLENEISYYYESKPNPVNTHQLIIETAKAAPAMTQELQNAIAHYIEYLATPQITTKQIAKHLFGKED